MRWLVTCLTFSAFFAIALVSPAQQSNRQPRKSQAPAKMPLHASSHDLSGVWLSNDPQAPGPRTQGVFATVFPPPMTEWGQARYDATKPQYGPRNVLHGNDPLDRCDPLGLPRMLTFYGPFQFIQLQDKILILYERERIWRQIWMDGRPLPRSRPQLVRLLHRPMGRRYFSRRHGGIERKKLGRPIWRSAQRRRASGGAIPPFEPKHHATGHDARRPQGLYETVEQRHSDAALEAQLRIPGRPLRGFRDGFLRGTHRQARRHFR